MSDYTKTHIDSEVFGKISPAIFQVILDTIPALGSVLNWEPLACAFLADVLRQISLNGNPLMISHVVFGRLLWGADITEVAAERRLGRCVNSLTKCQAMSGCLAVWIERGGRKEENGEVKYFRTSYRLRDFFEIFADIQRLAVEQDLIALPLRDRKLTQRAIVQAVCDARQYQRIPARARQQRHFQDKKAKSEPLPKAEALPPPRIASFSEVQAAYQERLFQELVAMGIGEAGRTLMDGALKATRLTEKRWLDAVRSNGKGVKR